VKHRAARDARRSITVLRSPKKENPAVGTPGQSLVVIGVYGFKYAAWLVLVTPGGAKQLVVFVQPTFFSCSSTFLFFYNVLKFNRTLCEFAAFSVGLRTHVSLGGTIVFKQDMCQAGIDELNQQINRGTCIAIQGQGPSL
jgi:hypothetical protein